MDIDTIVVLKIQKGIQNCYTLEQIGIDRIGNQKFYILYFYLANGEPEIYLFYNKVGKLLFSQICNRIKCENTIFDFDKKQALKYLNRTSSINFINVQ